MANNTAAEAGLVHASLEFISTGLRDYRDAASALGRYSKGNESVNDEIGAVLLEHTIFTNTMLEIFEASLPNNRDQWQDAGTAVKARANLGMSYGRYTDSIGIMLEDVKKLAKLAQLDENEEVGPHCCLLRSG